MRKYGPPKRRQTYSKVQDAIFQYMVGLTFIIVPVIISELSIKGNVNMRSRNSRKVAIQRALVASRGQQQTGPLTGSSRMVSFLPSILRTARGLARVGEGDKAAGNQVTRTCRPPLPMCALFRQSGLPIPQILWGSMGSWLHDPNL